MPYKGEGTPLIGCMRHSCFLAFCLLSSTLKKILEQDLKEALVRYNWSLTGTSFPKGSVSRAGLQSCSSVLWNRTGTTGSLCRSLMDKLDFSALCSRPLSEKSGACVEDVASITSAVQDFPLPQVQDVGFAAC